jgi:hypothetical protein
MIWVLATSGCASAHAPSFAPAPVADSAEARPRTERFYAGRDFGSEAQFNPFSLIVNGGLDQFRTGENRDFLSLPWRSSAHVVWHSLTHADAVVRHYGVRAWLRDEVFPLSTKGEGGGQWYPNYQLHLFAGGMTYRRMVEWYEFHDVSHPELAAGATVYAWHLVTELSENGTHCCEDEDGLTDLAIFDLGSIILWNQSWMQRPFGRSLEFTTWMGQASIEAPHHTIQNAFMMAMLRAPLPRTDSWKAMTTMGNAFLVGVSRRAGTDLWVSASGGFDPSDNPIIDPVTGAKTVLLKPNAGLFLDRDGSLLVSLVMKGGSRDGATLNVYPGVIRIPGVSPGVWAQTIQGGGFRFGVVARAGLGASWFAR